MDILEPVPGLSVLRYDDGFQSYLWQDGEELTLIDAGAPGSGDSTRKALRNKGFHEDSLRRIVLTHFHADHAGAVAEIRAWSRAEVFAHRLDTPAITGTAEPPEPVLLDWERPLFARTATVGLVGPPATVDTMLDGGETLNFGGGTRVLHTPGHTSGSVAYFLVTPRILFTGDTVATVGMPMLGVFNVDRSRLTESVRELSEVDAAILCPGHGDILGENVAATLRRIAAAG